MYGFHVIKGKHKRILDAITISIDNANKEFLKKISSAQIFVMGPMGSNLLIDVNDAQYVGEIRKYLHDNSIHLVVHDAYITHPFTSAKKAYGQHLIRQQLKVCEAIGAVGLVVHLPRAPPAVVAEGYRNISPKLNNINCKLFLEIESMKPTADTYETPEKLTALYDSIKEFDPDVGLCIDTAHVWAEGINLSTYAGASSWIAGVKRTGFKNLMIHLNDNNYGMGNGRDNHAELAKGKIWSGVAPADSGLRAFLEWATADSLIVILERPNGAIRDDLALIGRM